MIKNDIRYIIKRVIAALLIALILMLIRTKNVYAQEMSSTNVGTYTDTITTNTAFTDYSITGNPWANWRYGHLYFSFGINKESGSATDPLLVPRNVYASSDTTNYVCNFGTTSYGNSTYEGASYSVDCPMDLGWPGVTKISIAWMPISTQTTSTYKVVIGGWMTFEQNPNTTVNVDTSGTTTAINNQITNDNTNTTNIINNQNQNTQQQIESQKVCSMIDKSNVVLEGYYLYNNGSTAESANYGLTDFIPVVGGDLYVYSASNRSGSLVFYNTNKQVISGILNSSMTDNQQITIPQGTSYIRATIRLSDNLPTYKLCRNGNQAIADGQQQINDTLNNDDVTGASSEAESFFDNFQSDSHGLSGIITAPLRLIQGLASSSCTALTIPLPFVNENATLPCMSSIYSTYFPTFLSLYQLITTGIIGYWVLIKIFGHVKGMQDPTDDRIEVLEL